MNEKEYKERHEKLMKRWEKEVREWTNCTNATFYADGIFDPETWFEETNRILFILKEVNEKNEEEEKYINFVEKGVHSDPWMGVTMWRKVGTLAKGIFDWLEKTEDTPYCLLKNEKGEEENEYHRVLERIAIINLKKLAGGKTTGSEKSQSTFCYTCHAKHFSENLREQIIELINPTVIICCGKNSVAECLGMEDGKICGIPAVDGYHPTHNSTEDFYYKTLNEIKNRKYITGY